MTAGASRHRSRSDILSHDPLNNANAQASAFLGATLAFSQASKPAKSPPNGYSGVNGALAAATFVGPGQRIQDQQPNKGMPLNGGTGAAKEARMLNISDQTRSNATVTAMRPPSGNQRSISKEQSPSTIAALMAVSQATTPTRKPASTPHSDARRPSPLQRVRTVSTPVNMQPATSPSANTKSLAKLYESKEGQELSPTVGTTPFRPVLRSTASASVLPVPSRTVTAAKGAYQERQGSDIPLKIPSKLEGPATEVMTRQRSNGPDLPTPRRSQPPPDDRQETTYQTPASTTASLRPPLSRQTSVARYNRPQRPHCVRLSTETARPPSTYVPQLSVSALANAMVASSLASSRASSPTRAIPPLPPRHKLPHVFHRNHSQETVTRLPSPAKGMRTTMREPAKSDDEAEHHKKKNHLVRKHPNKHHEGDRKRYRTQITERERKRYEGVWAANKGLLIPLQVPNGQNEVLNIVAKDIWRRSRLPDDVLEEVWDLVNLDDEDGLGREEFVVGMWLIDQRLKGNKLPIRVSESVWASVRRLVGVEVRKRR